ncbi:MAG: PAS domain-containing protein [Prevotellaceae bacterium]|jgi:nitrogen fixation/metabolism regulation signal transduction histidine kinase|nr:PAS domain-containing protein [Prevotellaceae bacterium]
MFKSIVYRLHLYTALLAVSSGGAAALLTTGHPFYGAVCAAVAPLGVVGLQRCFRRYNRNLLFLLDALRNGDSAFHFSETRHSAREKELNAMLNRLKDVIVSARKEVIENENFLSVIVESVSTGILIIDDRGLVHRANRPALELLGLPVFSHVNQLRALDAGYPALFRGLKTGDRLQLTIPTDREEQTVSLRVSQIRLRRGMMRILTLNNIGSELELKEMESWIGLIRVMTHEIVNSIAPIASLSDTMRQQYRSAEPPPDDAPQTTLEAFEIIHSTAAGLLSFVESYRRFTAIPTPKKQDFDLQALFDKVVKLHEPALQAAHIDMRLALYEPVTLHADERLIAQVLINLVKNAIEAADPSGGTTIILSSDRPSPDKIGVYVSNSGPAIPPDVLPHIFVPFFTTKSSGSGVGLSVSRYIMRLHGGALHHSRTKDGFTVFSLLF